MGTRDNVCEYCLRHNPRFAVMYDDSTPVIGNEKAEFLRCSDRKTDHTVSAEHLRSLRLKEIAEAARSIQDFFDRSMAFGRLLTRFAFAASLILMLLRVVCL